MEKTITKDLQASYLENNALKVDDENSSNGELIFSETSTKDMISTPHQQLFSIKNAFNWLYHISCGGY
jgi:hypothetical protein